VRYASGGHWIGNRFEVPSVDARALFAKVGQLSNAGLSTDIPGHWAPRLRSKALRQTDASPPLEPLISSALPCWNGPRPCTVMLPKASRSPDSFSMAQSSHTNGEGTLHGQSPGWQVILPFCRETTRRQLAFHTNQGISADFEKVGHFFVVGMRAGRARDRGRRA
jgi:hypothetical protein